MIQLPHKLVILTESQIEYLQSSIQFKLASKTNSSRSRAVRTENYFLTNLNHNLSTAIPVNKFESLEDIFWHVMMIAPCINGHTFSTSGTYSSRSCLSCKERMDLYNLITFREDVHESIDQSSKGFENLSV